MSTQISVPWANNKPQPSTASQLARKLTMPLLLIAFAVFLVVNMLTMSVPASVDFPGPRFFPAIIATGLIILSVIDIAMVFISLAREKSRQAAETTGSFRDGDPTDQADENTVNTFDFVSLLWSVGGFVLFIVTLSTLGWILSAAILFWCVAFGFGAKRHLHSLVVGLTLSSLTYLAFSLGLGLPLPAGFIGGIF